MTPSDKAEAERRYPSDGSLSFVAVRANDQRAAYIAGREAVRAAIAASGPAAGVGYPVAWHCRSSFSGEERVTTLQNVMEGLEADDWVITPLYRAASPPPAPAGERERVIEAALKDAMEELVIGCAFSGRGQPDQGIAPYPNLSKRMAEASERARRALASSPPPAPAGERAMPHHYVPDTSQYQGDCAICGNVRDAPVHVEPAPAGERERVIALEELSEAEWSRVDENCETCRVNVHILDIYRFPDGHASVAENQVWISAMFANPEAAASWAGHYDEAEQKWNLDKPNYVARRALASEAGPAEGER